MTDETVLRRGTATDNEPCYRLFLESVVDLTVRQGVAWEPDADELWPRLKPLYDLLAEHAAEWWVAVDGGGEIVGYARSVERGGLFELSEFFVRPGRQSSGVGRRLLESAFPLGRGEVRAIIATTDVRAQRSYYRAGTVARFPIASLSAPPRADAWDAATTDLRPVRAAVPDVPALLAIERAVLEFDRGPAEMAWLLGVREGYLYLRDGRPVGSGFVGASGEQALGGAGPVAALDPADQPAILLHLESRAADLGRKDVSFEVPMVNEVAMNHLFGRRYEMDTFLTFLMTSRPFGQFDRFIGMSPPFVL
jgi:GNAT superfamily N-acetyltransferase